MTISSTALRHIYNGLVPAATTLAINFPFNAASDIQVKLVNETTGVRSVLVGGGVNYTISPTGSVTPYPGGTISGDEIPAGSTWYITRRGDIDQPTDYTSNTKFPADAHERQADRESLQRQDVEDLANRSLHAPAEDGQVNFEWPNFFDRKNRVWQWDATGRVLNLSLVTELTTVLTTISDYMRDTFLSLASKAAVQTELEIHPVQEHLYFQKTADQNSIVTPEDDDEITALLIPGADGVKAYRLNIQVACGDDIDEVRVYIGQVGNSTDPAGRYLTLETFTPDKAATVTRYGMLNSFVFTPAEDDRIGLEYSASGVGTENIYGLLSGNTAKLTFIELTEVQV